jgi:hypothetical protein
MSIGGIEPVLNPAWPVPLALLVAAGLAAFVWFTYRPRIAHLPPVRRRLLLGLRFATIVVLLFALLRPELRYSETDDSDAVLVILGDVSRSMTVPDAAGGKTRRTALVDDLKANAAKFKALGEGFEVRYLDFAEAASEPEGAEGAKPDATGEQTAIGSTLDALLRSTGAEKLAGVLLLSDGAQRAIPPADADPRDVAQRYGELGLPIYPVPYGGDGGEAAFDLAVEDLAVDPVVFERKAVPLTARVRISGGAGRAYMVRVLLEDRSGKMPGETGELKPAIATDNSTPLREVKTDQNNAVLPVDLSFVPQLPGEYKVAVEIVPAEGEVKTTNNRRETIINVQKGGLRVAYFTSLGSEQRWIRNVNTDQKIQLDFKPVRTGAFGQRDTIDATWFDPGKYDAYIIGDVPASAFGAANAKLLADRIRDGAGLMMLGGPRSFGPGGWASTPIGPLLPVEMEPGSVDPANALDPTYHHNRPLLMVPTRIGLQRYVMQLGSGDPKEVAALWRSLPPLEGANRLEPKTGGLEEVLAESEDGVPLLVATQIDPARIIAFAGDTTYLWFTAGHQAEHQRFWRQVILWLTRKDLDKDQPVWVLAEPRNAAPGQSIALTYGARDAKGVPVTNAGFELEVMRPGGGSDRPPAPGGAERNTIDYGGTTKPGDYWVRVAATKDRQALGLDGWTRFLVDSRDLELDNPAADPALLQELAELSGGSVYPPEQLATLLDRWIVDPPGRERLTVYRRTTLWDNAFLLAIFVALIGSEWFLRKRYGLV